jgi:hypothetical protein
LQLRSIILKSLDTDVDFLNKYGLQWLSDNIFTDKVEIVVGKKEYNGDREDAIFKLINEGAILSDGQLYNQINGIINS